MKEASPPVLQLLDVKLTVTVNDSMIDACLKLTMFTNVGVLDFASRYLRTLLFIIMVYSTNYIL